MIARREIAASAANLAACAAALRAGSAARTHFHGQACQIVPIILLDEAITELLRVANQLAALVGDEPVVLAAEPEPAPAPPVDP